MKGDMIKLTNYPITKQIASWLYLDGHPVARPMKSTNMICRDYFRELIERLTVSKS